MSEKIVLHTTNHMVKKFGEKYKALLICKKEDKTTNINGRDGKFEYCPFCGKRFGEELKEDIVQGALNADGSLWYED